MEKQCEQWPLDEAAGHQCSGLKLRGQNNHGSNNLDSEDYFSLKKSWKLLIWVLKK
jgi:hypothetical protein